MRISLFSRLFLNSFIAVFFSITAVLVCGQCQSNQRDLLLGLKRSLKYNSTGKLVTWNQTTDCCSWEGVSCDAGGRVIGLDLSNQSISGLIDNSNSLFRLHYLQNLNLGYNKFNSGIPSRFDELANLNYLNLSNAGFVGQIPVGISRMTRLVTLDLSTLLFTGQPSLKLENPNLRKLVQNLTRLEQLRLDGVNISAQRKDWCHAISASLTELQVLSMSNCYLSGPIEPILQNLKNLSVIHLDKNNLSAKVPAFLAKFSNLTSLRLSSCGLHGVFPKDIFQVRMLESLDIADNGKLHGSLPEFHHNSSLRNLVLSRTMFSGSLPQSIGNLVNLTRLDLSSCNFSGAILNSITHLQQLVYLDLSSNNFTGQIPPFDMSKNLAHLDLSHNKLNGKIQSYEWEGLQYLTYIDLSHNSLHGNIPSSLLALLSLKKLQLSDNQFDGKVPGFPNVRQSLLETLDLSNNRLQGPIPASVFELSGLNILLLSSNKFSGTIWLGNVQKLVNLTRLGLSHNNLSVNATGSYSTLSSFPNITRLELASCKLKVFPDLKKQSRLTYLDLSDNQISGEVPNWIWNVGNSFEHLNLSFNQLVGLQKPYQMSNLLVLDLHSNKLNGNIPTLLPSAVYLDYSSNKFTSSLPHNIGYYLSNTIFFSLSSNGLTGVIPNSICDASCLQVLDLSKNNLSGAIPKCLSRGILSLVVLNLRGNRLSGNIPDAFPSPCSIQTLNVNSNELQGRIPRSLAGCKRLEVLDLGNNHINDSFPCHLKNIASLRILVLRSNEFHGKIGCCPANPAPWPKLQIVDIAHNSFNGMLPKKCLTTWEAMMVDDDKAQLNVKHLQFEVLQLTGIYYVHSMTITNKGLTMELVKILTLFTSIDLSCNKFEGPIPDVIGELKALYVLNLSHNALSGKIPPSLGKLQQLESLDLSSNNLSGGIPQQLVNLTFLAVLNLSHNQLEGSIPAGKQFGTFTNDSYDGNKGLCGSPLTKRCKDVDPGQDSRSDAAEKIQNDEFDWQFIFIGVGFGVGAAVFVATLIFWKKASKWVDENVDKILAEVLPKLGLTYTRPDYAKIEADETLEEDNKENDDDEEESKERTEEFRGRYCVFCSKLDKTRMKAIHDLSCTCYGSPSLSPSSSTSSSFSP